MEKRYLEIRCVISINEDTGMVGLFQKDIDEAIAGMFVFMGRRIGPVYICKDYAGVVIASDNAGTLLGSGALASRMCKAFLEGYCYKRYGQSDALTAKAIVSITDTMPDRYPKNFKDYGKL